MSSFEDENGDCLSEFLSLLRISLDGILSGISLGAGESLPSNVSLRKMEHVKK